MILIAIGANLPSPGHDSPRSACEAAVEALDEAGIRVVRRSRWYRTSPVPPSAQPDFVNGVVAVETTLEPAPLLARLHVIEARFGRVRRELNAARPLDLDIIAYDDRISEGPPVLPHPRMATRAFVLRPLADIAPDWRHPATGASLAQLIAALPDEGIIEPLA